MQRIGSIPCRKLIIHSPTDEVIPFTMGQRLFAAASEPKEFYQTTGGHNASPLSRESGYQATIAAFLQARQ